MFYKKTESYSFSCPREFKAYLAFKDELKASGVKFVDEGGSMMQTISIVTNGHFDVDDTGHAIKKEELNGK